MKRPFLVTVISIVMIVIGLAQMGIGITVLVERNDDTFLTDADMTSSQATGFGIALLVIGTLSVLLAFGLLRGSRLSRALIGLVEVSQIVSGIYALVKLDSNRQASAIGMIVGALIVLYFLFGTDKAKAFFAR
ncbi:MAG TPA: hypothetical protein VMW33_10515 [Ilumatobacteraceae bacterium]|jgi:hypothetical protein|nr:hypothetical protein [Ilumatobacteraceae bacterium]